jgi:bacterioferritin
MSRALFDELIADEEGHIDFLETQLDLFDKLGEEKYEMLNAKPADQAE